MPASFPRRLPGKAALVFVDPPYSTHLEYSDDPRCIGLLDALSLEDAGAAYYQAMWRVLAEAARVLQSGGVLAVYVSDSFKKGNPNRFAPIGFELFALARHSFADGHHHRGSPQRQAGYGQLPPGRRRRQLLSPRLQLSLAL